MKNIPQEKRDQFLEELRRHVDKEYGKEIRDQKEAKMCIRDRVNILYMM